MFSATDFLPRVITTFMNLASSTFPNFGSGRISRFGTSRRRGMARVLDQILVSARGGRTGGGLVGGSRRRRYAAVGFLAPYFERACLRSLTPAVSSEPRTM